MSVPDLWLIGAGPMAMAYAAVLDDLGVEYAVVGRGERSAAAFTSATGRAVRIGGVDSALHESGPPSLAIVAVSVDQLSETAGALLDPEDSSRELTGAKAHEELVVQLFHHHLDLT